MRKMEIIARDGGDLNEASLAVSPDRFRIEASAICGAS
jgi:hypothetical protein